MSAKRFSFRQSWDAVKYATELCQRSFGSNFNYLSSTSGQREIQYPRPAFTRNYSPNDDQCQSGRTSTKFNYSESCYSVDSDPSISSSVSSIQKVRFPETSYVPEHGKRVTTIITALPELHKEKPAVFRSATAEDIDTFLAAHPFPPPHGGRLTRDFCYRWFSAYRRLWIFALVANVAVIGAMIPLTLHQPAAFSYDETSTATGANLMVAALMRQEHVTNAIFRLACLLPNHAPISIRKRAAKVYSYGGLHSGCAISACLWYILTVVLIFTRFHGTKIEFNTLAGLSIVTLAIFVVIIVLSHPYIRRCKHDIWEASHRFGGWTATSLVWAQALVLVVAQAHSTQQPVSKVLVNTPIFWFLVIITVCLIYPWLRLRKRQVKTEVLSSHAIRLYFDDRTLPACVGYKLAHNPLVENHSFATISNTADEEVGFSIIVSNNGDFTKNMITNPPSNIYTRGAPTIGFMRVATLFQRIIIVTTGSGIGPALSFMNVRPHWPVRVIWSARDPENTYGLEIINAVLRADRRAIIVDTKKTGHPNMAPLTYAAYQSFGAEAVMVVSNPAVTAKVVFEMESRGVPAFGPIFDS